jgi:hypothetical protein
MSMTEVNVFIVKFEGVSGGASGDSWRKRPVPMEVFA